jgi:hypothetical protein
LHVAAWRALSDVLQFFLIQQYVDVIVTRCCGCLQGEHWRFAQGVRWWLNTLADAAALRAVEEAAAGQLPTQAKAAAAYDAASVQQQLQQAAQQMDGYMDMGLEQRQQLLQQLQAQLLPQVGIEFMYE